jgi:hypothetical protein
MDKSKDSGGLWMKHSPEVMVLAIFGEHLGSAVIAGITVQHM